jgi:hypothetical protein
MSFNYSASSSLSKDPGVEKTFIEVLHQAAQEIGSTGGRNYIVISGGKLRLSPKKSEAAPFEELTKFVSQKLEGLKETEVAQVQEDLSKLQAKDLREEQAKLNISSDLLRATMGFLDLKDYGNAKKVSKSWDNGIDERVRKTIYIAMSFGPQMWKKHFGVDVGEAPALSQEQLQILDSPCPFWPGKKVVQTHKVFFHPATFKKETHAEPQPLTIRSFRELIKNPTDVSKKTDYRNIWDQILTDHGDTSSKTSQWEIMTKDVLPGSRNKSYAAQQTLATATPGYDVPNLLSAILCIQTEYMKTGVVLYGRDPWTYTRTKEQFGGFEVCVGGFAPAGLDVDFSFDGDRIGVAALRKF